VQRFTGSQVAQYQHGERIIKLNAEYAENEKQRILEDAHGIQQAVRADNANDRPLCFIGAVLYRMELVG